MKLSFPIYIKFNSRRQLEIVNDLAPYGIRTQKRITEYLLKSHKPVQCKPNAIKIALKYQRLKDEGMTVVDIARQYGISRVRVHQFLKLLNLDKDFVQMLANTDDPKVINHWTERRLRIKLK